MVPPADSTPEPKHCKVCGRRMEWRARWAKNWAELRYCSDGCRREGLRPIDHELEAAILALLEARPATATICPSEAARRVSPDAWESLMEPARRAARRLVHAGRVQILQQGRVVDPSEFRGPIRLRLIGLR